MRLLKARITGYSSFKDTGWVQFEPGINLIVGQNNSGKSAILKALQPAFSDNRHRDEDEHRLSHLPRPRVEMYLSLSGVEFRDAILRRGAQVVLPTSWDEEPDELVKRLFETSQMLVHRISFPDGANSQSERPIEPMYLTHQGKNIILNPYEGRVNISGGGAGGNTMYELAEFIWRTDMFYFSAQRYSVGSFHFVRQDRLDSAASNLAAVLAAVAGDRGDTFDHLVRHVRDIFPSVQNLSITTTGNGFEIRTWPTARRQIADLSFGLDDSGTGVAQVIAILTAVMTMDSAVIIVDEINSFLHPAAAKALLRILQTDYPQHQYIISTHSPEVISFSNPRSVHLVRREGYTSDITRLDLNKLEQLREVAGHLGVSTTDVFAADRILWVEGQTEELCFPFIYEQVRGRALPFGVKIVAVLATGDFDRRARSRELVFKIYERLSESADPLLRSVLYSFDQETLSAAEIEQLKRDSRRKMHFLPRRHFESYLLEPEAIAALINSELADLANPITSEAVALKLAELGAGTRLGAPQGWNGDLSDQAWLLRVDAANLIDAVISDLTECRLKFSKTRHSIALLKHILANRPEHVQELTNYVVTLVDEVAKQPA